jgi:hypothetical protein
MDQKKAKMEMLARTLHERRGTHEVHTALELLDGLLEGVKNNLLTCDSNAFNRLQGEAQAYDKLIRLITRPSINLQKAKE